MNKFVQGSRALVSGRMRNPDTGNMETVVLPQDEFSRLQKFAGQAGEQSRLYRRIFERGRALGRDLPGQEESPEPVARESGIKKQDTLAETIIGAKFKEPEALDPDGVNSVVKATGRPVDSADFSWGPPPKGTTEGSGYVEPRETAFMFDHHGRRGGLLALERAKNVKDTR